MIGMPFSASLQSNQMVFETPDFGSHLSLTSDTSMESSLPGCSSWESVMKGIPQNMVSMMSVMSQNLG